MNHKSPFCANFGKTGSIYFLKCLSFKNLFVPLQPEICSFALGLEIE